ncbi:phage tail length tape measure family protein [Rhizobium sp. RAF36]|uniref:phage tail length tape measure family protein n=1 Tax=Rhizobium sp. RAF36 TaxID=3233055 RepID=UPI003F9C5D4A
MASTTERKIVELVIDASSAEAGARKYEQALDHLGIRQEQAQARVQAAMERQQRIYSSDLPVSIDRTAQAVDKLRAGFDPLFKVQARAEQQMVKTIETYQLALRRGVISEEEFTRDIAMLKQKQINDIERVRLAQDRASPVANDNAAGRRQNLGYQGFDIAQGLASGMPLGMIAAQQGPQVAQLYGGPGGLKNALGDVESFATSVVTTIGAMPLALAAAGTAAIMYAKRSEVSLENVDQVIEKHRANIASLREAYGVAEQGAKSYSAAEQQIAVAATKGDLDEMQKYQLQAARELRMQFGSMQTPGKGGQAFFNVFPDYKPFAGAFNDLDKGIRDGRIEGEKFIDAISEITRINPEYEKFSNKILEAAKQFLQINTEISKTKDLLTQIGTLAPLDPLGVFSPERDAQSASDRTPSLFKQQQDRIAALRQEVAARSPAEKEAAARASAAAQFNPSESTTDRDYRIDLAGMQARIAAEHQLAEAQRERVRSLNESVNSQQLDISLIGKTIGEQTALREAYQLTAQLREEAARNNTKVDEQEIELIKQKAAEMGRLADLYARLQLRNDLQFERDQIFRSDEDQQIAGRLRSAGQPVDFSSAEAGLIRDNIRLQELRDGVKGFFSDFRDGLLKGDGLGQALGNAILNALNNVLTKMTDRLIDQLVNGLVGNGTGSGSGLLSKLFSGASAAPANDNFAANTTLSKLLGVGAANDNAAVGSIANFAAAIKANESGGNYSALGPLTRSGDRAYGAYQVMGANVGPWTQQALGYSMTPSAFLASSSAQDAVFQKVFGGYVGKYGASGAAQAWFGGPGSVGGNGAARDILGTSGTEYVNKFNASLSRLGDTTASTVGDMRGLGPAVGNAAQGLSTFGNGLGQFGQSLGNIQQGGGGGFFSELLGKIGGFFGGVSPTSSFWAPNTTYGAFLGLSGGGYTGPGGVNDPAGIVHRGEVVWSQSDIERAGGVATVEAMRLGKRGYAMGGAGGYAPSSSRTSGPQAANVNVDVKVMNNNGSDVKVQKRNTADGLQLDVIIDQAVADKINTPGSQSRSAMKSQFGLTGSLARR